MCPKTRKTALNSFAGQFLRVSPLFRRFATVGSLLTVSKLLIPLEGGEGGGINKTVNMAAVSAGPAVLLL